MNVKATIYQTSSARHLRLGGNIGNYVVDRYPSGELKIILKDDAHPGGVFIVGSVLPEAESLLELMILADALKERTSNVTIIIPYLAYARQDKPEKGEPFTARVVCNILNTAGFYTAYIIDAHNTRLYSFFSFRNVIPVDIFAKELSGITKPVVIAPDKGGVERAKEMAEILGSELACIEKTRVGNGREIHMHLMEEIDSEDALIIDDIIDTGGTVLEAADLLKQKGIKNIYVAATHGLFSGDAIKNLEKSNIKKIIVTNTLPLSVSSGKIRVVKIEPLIEGLIQEG